jgi:hypothetical protein
MSNRLYVPPEPVSTRQFLALMGVLAALGVMGWFAFPTPVDWISVIGAIGGLFIALLVHVRVGWLYEQWRIRNVP